jgi:hypothetical protein
MKNQWTQRRRQERGSALLLTLLLTLLGAILLGLSADAMSLLWVRTHTQNTANLAAAAVQLEQEQSPSASREDLEAAARATAARNGFASAGESGSVRLEQVEGKTSVVVECDAAVYFLRIVRPQPVAVRARAAVALSAIKAGL